MVQAKDKQAKSTEKKQHNPRVLNGIVVSNKMDKTAVVKVDRQVIHPKYKKICGAI